MNANYNKNELTEGATVGFIQTVVETPPQSYGDPLTSWMFVRMDGFPSEPA